MSFREDYYKVSKEESIPINLLFHFIYCIMI